MKPCPKSAVHLKFLHVRYMVLCEKMSWNHPHIFLASPCKALWGLLCRVRATIHAKTAWATSRRGAGVDSNWSSGRVSSIEA